jgi:outer membrane immunogenic protein
MRPSTLARPVVMAAAVLAGGMTAAQAQEPTWTGFYLGGHVGRGTLRGDDKFVRFDTNLDGTFGDTVRTAAGVDAFSPGFCAGAALTTTPAGGCVQDEEESDFGGRLGYDWQSGRVVIGVVGEVSRLNLIDSVTAFSVTPARYTFTRELDLMAGLGVRVGAGTERFLVYVAGAGVGAKLDRSFATSNQVNTFVQSEEERAFGYQFGGGLDVRLGNLTVGGQYLVTSLGDQNRYTVRAQGPAPATNAFILVNPSGTDFRRSDDFKFKHLRLTAALRF